MTNRGGRGPLFPMPRRPNAASPGGRSSARSTIARSTDLVPIRQSRASRRSPRRSAAHASAPRCSKDDVPVGVIGVALRPSPASYAAATDRSAPDLRRPGGDRDPERAAVQRDQGGAGAADRDRGGASRHQQFPERPRARLSHDPREHHAALRVADRGAVPVRRGAPQRRRVARHDRRIRRNSPTRTTQTQPRNDDPAGGAGAAHGSCGRSALGFHVHTDAARSLRTRKRPHRSLRADAEGRHAHRRHHHLAPRSPAVRRAADRP